MTHSSAPSDWEACPPGRLQEAAHHQKQGIQRRQLLRKGVTGLAVVGVSGLAWMLYRLGTNPHEITCQQAVNHMNQWAALDKALQDRTLAHARICPKCQSKMIQLGIVVNS